MKNLKRIMAISSVLVTLYGVGMIVYPTFIASEYGIVLTSTTIPLTQLLGAYCIGFGFLNWLGSKSTALETLCIITLADFITDFITVIISGMERYHGILNAWGWEIFILHLFFMCAFGYYLLKLRKIIQSPTM
jgi:hypothetical protein